MSQKAKTRHHREAKNNINNKDFEKTRNNKNLFVSTGNLTETDSIPTAPEKPEI